MSLSVQPGVLKLFLAIAPVPAPAGPLQPETRACRFSILSSSCVLPFTQFIKRECPRKSGYLTRGSERMTSADLCQVSPAPELVPASTRTAGASADRDLSDRIRRR